MKPSRDTSTENGSRIAVNLFWLLADKAFLILDGLLVGALVAKYLGPGQLGQLAYANSLTSLILPLVLLGTEKIAIRNFVQRPKDRDTDFSAVFISRLTTSVFFFALLSFLLWLGILPTENRSDYWILMLAFGGLMTQSLLSVRLLLEAEVLSKWTVWTTKGWMVLSAIVKLILVFNHGSVEAFALNQLAISVFTAVTLYIIVSRLEILPKIEMPPQETIRQLLSESWPVAIGGILLACYMNLDISMIRWMVNSKEAGIYSVAVTMSSFWYFLPMSIQSTYFPILSACHQEGDSKFQQAFRQYVDINVVCAYLSTMIGWLVMPMVISLMFGDAYLASCNIFRVHIFSLIFVFLGVAATTFLTIDGKHGHTLVIRIVGAIINLCANLALIRWMGGTGAAIATLVAYAATGFVVLWFMAGTRSIAREISLSLIFSPFRVATLLRNRLLA